MEIIKISFFVCAVGVSVLLSACAPESDVSVFAAVNGGGGGGGSAGIDAIGVIQLTTKPAGSSEGLGYPDPVISGDGSTVLFISTEDYTGANADNSPELFLIKADGTGLVQITNSATVVSTKAVVYFDISDDGSVIVFDGAYDHLGDGTNADLGREVFTINADGTGLAQITNGVTSSDTAYSPHITGDGSLVTYKKGGLGIFIQNLSSSIETQLVFTNLTLSYSVSGDGTKLVFCSFDDLTTNNADLSEEIFIVNTDGSGLAQLTNDVSQNSCEPRISDNGNVVAFTSNGDLVVGSNSDLNREIFVINSNGTGLAQLTSTTSLNIAPLIEISGDGTSIVFQSTNDFSGLNPTFNDSIFLANADGSGIILVSSDHDSIYESAAPAISNNAGSVVFQSDLDFTGENAAHNLEVFIDTIF